MENRGWKELGSKDLANSSQPATNFGYCSAKSARTSNRETRDVGQRQLLKIEAILHAI